jgi:hypothetical protein
MERFRREAGAMLDRIGPNADHLPEEWRKEAHRKMKANLEQLVESIDKNLLESPLEKPSPPRAPPRRGRSSGRDRPA